MVNFSAPETETVKKSAHIKGKSVTGRANTGGGGFPSLPPQIMPIIGIIVLGILLFLLLRTCSGCSFGGSITDQSSRPPNSPPVSSAPPSVLPNSPPVPSVPPSVLPNSPPVPSVPPSVLPSITYSDIHFVKDTLFFLSEGDNYANVQPSLSEGKYEDRLNKIAEELKGILAVLPNQTFIITGYAADIPGHDEGELELSKQRAERVMDFLVRLGVPAKSIQCIYRGGTNRWGDNSSEETRRENRVVTIELKQ